MMNKKGVGIITVIVVALIVAVIASFATVSLTGNIIKVPTSVATTQSSVYTTADVYNKSQIDAKIFGNYLDPTKCMYQTVSNRTDPTHYVSLDCGNTKVIQYPNVVCPQDNNVARLTGVARLNNNALPSLVSYVCVNSAGAWNDPKMIEGYCCDIIKK